MMLHPCNDIYYQLKIEDIAPQIHREYEHNRKLGLQLLLVIQDLAQLIHCWDILSFHWIIHLVQSIDSGERKM